MDINDIINFDTEEIDRLLKDAMDGTLSTELAPGQTFLWTAC